MCHPYGLVNSLLPAKNKSCNTNKNIKLEAPTLPKNSLYCKSYENLSLTFNLVFALNLFCTLMGGRGNYLMLLTVKRSLTCGTIWTWLGWRLGVRCRPAALRVRAKTVAQSRWVLSSLFPRSSHQTKMIRHHSRSKNIFLLMLVTSVPGISYYRFYKLSIRLIQYYLLP